MFRFEWWIIESQPYLSKSRFSPFFSCNQRFFESIVRDHCILRDIHLYDNWKWDFVTDQSFIIKFLPYGFAEPLVSKWLPFQTFKPGKAFSRMLYNYFFRIILGCVQWQVPQDVQVLRVIPQLIRVQLSSLVGMCDYSVCLNLGFFVQIPHSK